ncbi:hypothetical protein BJX96DRAFT_171664 [Aspergillus floccosus]
MCRYTSGPAASDMFNLLFPVVQMLIRAGANPADCGGPTGFSTFSYLFSHNNGLVQFQHLLKDHVEMSTLDELCQLDTWIVATMARADKIFMAKLNSQLAEFHTAPDLSTIPQQFLSLEQVSLSNQVRELQAAEMSLRVEFIRAVCRQGSAAMLEPLFKAGIDVHEADNLGRYSYLGEAVTYGNHEATIALLNARADVNAGAECPPALALFSRWTNLGTDARAITQIRSEFPLLEEIIRTPNVDISCTPSLLTRTLFLPESVKVDCATILADVGFGISLRRLSNDPGNPYASIANHSTNPNRDGAEWHELQAAVLVNDLVMLDFLLSRGAHIEDEDEAGCTALLAALELGRPQIVCKLVDAGAQIRRKSMGAGLSATDVAMRNVAAMHPRMTSLHFDHRPRFTAEMVPVELEDDMRSFEIIREATSRKQAFMDTPIVPATRVTLPNAGGKALWGQNILAELKYQLYCVRQIDWQQGAIITLGLMTTILAWIWCELTSFAMLCLGKRRFKT